MMEQQVQDALSTEGVFLLDETIADFQQGWAADQEDDSASNDGFEEATPSDMLNDDISLLDGAILMLDELITPAGKAWNDRHTAYDTPAPPLQDPTAWLGTNVPGADTLYNISTNTTLSGTLLAHSLSAQCSKNDMSSGRLPWDIIFTDKCPQLLPLRAGIDYSAPLDIQAPTGAAELLQHIFDTIPLRDQPFFTAELAEMIKMDWPSDTPPPSGMIEVLRRDPVPVWAAAPQMTAKLTALRQAHSAFTQVESSVLQIIA